MPGSENHWIGRPVPRAEDLFLIRGQGRYVSDIEFDNQWTMALVRSPHPHALIKSIRLDKAKELVGVHAVLTAESFERLKQPIPGMEPIAPTPLADQRVRYVGEPIVAILADNRYLAEDAIERVEISYEPLPVLTQAEDAVSSATKLHPEFGSNILDTVEYQSGDGKAALAHADHVIRATLKMGRVSAQPMEPRGIAAQFDPNTGGLLVYHSTQSVHRAQERIAQLLQLEKSQVHVIAPDVGGGFGVKNGSYPEEALVCFFAHHYQRAIKWNGDRFEEFLSTYQEREQIHDVELGLMHDGTIVGISDTYYQDNGAYPGGGVLVSRTTARNIPGPYRIPNIEIHGYAVMTNKVPQAPYRGAGRPQGHYVIERMLDRAADALGLDRIAIREKNLVRADDLPYTVGIPDMIYDSGNFPIAFSEAIERIDTETFRRRQEESLHKGQRLGLGIANYVEISAGFGFENVRLTLQPDGGILLTTGATGQGQGHRTSLAQVAAEALDLPLDQITVVEGDTGQIDKGIGTFGSRTMIMAGNAARISSEGFLKKAKARAADLLEAHVDDILCQSGRFFVEGVPSLSLSWADLARHREMDHLEPLAYEDSFTSQTPTYGFGCHAIIVNVDPNTCDIRIERYVIVHDGGTIINPLLANGQVIGGTVQGLGTALYEEMVYSPDGQPLTTSFLDYRLPGANESPDIEIYHQNHAAPSNPGGYKGVGEAGIIPSQALILSAVEDAFRDLHLKLNVAPITPGRLYQSLQELKGGDRR